MEGNPLDRDWGQVDSEMLPAKRARDGGGDSAGTARIIAFLESQSGLGLSMEEYNNEFRLAEFLSTMNPESREALYDAAVVDEDARLSFDMTIHKLKGKTLREDQIKKLLKDQK